MLTKNDLVLLLSEIQDIDTTKYIQKLMISPSIDLEVLRFVNSRRQLDVSKFYELIRKNYNSKKSPLYKNIVKEERDDVTEVLTTLSALQLQIFLYAKKLENSEMFLKHSRLTDITFVLNNYSTTYDLKPCLKLLKLIKADLKAFESVRQ